MDMPQATSTEQAAEETPRALLRTSHSALSDFLSCPEKFRQGRILKRPDTPAWWSVGGTAVHSTTEEFDRWYLTAPTMDIVENFPWEDRFGEIFAREMTALRERTGIPWEDWRAAGEKNARRTTEDREFWLKNGPGYARNWGLWRAQNPDWSVWGTPSREPAIELELDAQLFGVAVKAYLDRVLVNDRGELLVADLKAGSSTPDTLDQLLVYRALLAEVHGVQADLGGFFNARKGDLYKERLDVEDVTDTAERFAMFMAQAEAGEYLARPGEQCAFRCSYATHCNAAKRLTGFWKKKAGI